jgi:hypothetical protein
MRSTELLEQVKPTERNGHGPARRPLDPVADGESVTDGRAANGRFIKGNKCGRGNPFARKLAAMRQAFLDAISEDDLKAVARRLLLRAEAGDTTAAKVLLAYVIGKPAKATNPDSLDAEEWASIDSWPTQARVLRALLDGCHPGESAELARQVADASTVKGEIFKKDKHLRQDAVAERQARIGKVRRTEGGES